MGQRISNRGFGWLGLRPQEIQKPPTGGFFHLAWHNSLRWIYA